MSLTAYAVLTLVLLIVAATVLIPFGAALIAALLDIADDSDREIDKPYEPLL